LKQGYVAIDDELVRPVPCLLPRRAFNSQRNPLKKPALTRMLVTSGHWASAEAPEA
jgi:hypothetical protein